MEEKLNVLEFISNLKNMKIRIDEIITRKYIPSDEKDDIVSYVTTILFGKFDENGKLIATDVYQEPNLFLDDFFTTVAIIGAYTNIDTTDRKLVYDTFMENNLFDTLLENIADAHNFNYMLRRQINAKREYIKNNQKSSADEVLESLNILLSTLNDKAKELDVKKLDKMLKKLTPQEVVKAYQKSGIGNDVRDKTIQELRNQISSKNVKA